MVGTKNIILVENQPFLHKYLTLNFSPVGYCTNVFQLLKSKGSALYEVRIWSILLQSHCIYNYIELEYSGEGTVIFKEEKRESLSFINPQLVVFCLLTRGFKGKLYIFMPFSFNQVVMSLFLVKFQHAAWGVLVFISPDSL